MDELFSLPLARINMLRDPVWGSASRLHAHSTPQATFVSETTNLTEQSYRWWYPHYQTTTCGTIFQLLPETTNRNSAPLQPQIARIAPKPRQGDAHVRS